MFNTELLRAVAALARVAGLALILHNAPGGPEQIMHVREGIRFELYDGGYSQLKLVVPPWRERGAAETPEFTPAPGPKGQTKRMRLLRNRVTQRARTWPN